jgi:CheY-like chemotaxis protein
LNTIILLSHVVEREGTSPADEERRRHDIAVIRESAETLLRMINNILDLAKIEAGQRDLYPERLALVPFLRETADLLEPQARVVLRASPWQDSVAFEVEDTGTGIPAHLIAAAFEPFRQIRTGSGEAGRGTGLGLPISKQLVEVMGGDLLLDSREGRGTRVSFTLPGIELPPETAAAAAKESGTAPGPSGPAPSGPCRQVLVVEDDDASRYGLKSLLESEGYLVLEAASLGQADDALKKGAPDMMVVDITLPDGDGAEWARQQMKKGPLGFPVIALTGVTADEDRKRIEQSGVSAVLQKPVDIPLFLKVLRDCQTR